MWLFITCIHYTDSSSIVYYRYERTFFFATITIIDNLITTYDSNNRFRDKFNEY